jgi:hypothetical protein
LSLPLSNDERVILCSSATSDDAISCFNLSVSRGLSLNQRSKLCTELSPSSW